MVDAAHPEIDSKRYRQVLGQYPTGVSVITSIDEQGKPAAMIVGSFTSVSLSPPLVAFFPARDSNSWAKIRQCRSFCVNILSSDQEAICRRLSSKDADKFAGTSHRLSSAGNPILDGVVAWIDCLQHSVSEAGDHDIVLGRVLELDIADGELPLLFFKGGYGRFTPASLAALDSPIITQSQLRLIEHVRPYMETLTTDLGACCIATVRSSAELVVAATAGTPRHGDVPALVGQRLPFRPPTGTVFAAWLSPVDAQKWLATARADDQGEHYEAKLLAVRKRGYSVGLLDDAHRTFLKTLGKVSNRNYESHQAELARAIAALAYDPMDLSTEAQSAVRLISVPVFDHNGDVPLALTLHSFRKPIERDGFLQLVTRLRGAAQSITQLIGGREPATAH